MRIDDVTTGAARAEKPAGLEHRGVLPRRSWANWILMASSYLITTTGLALVVATLLPERLSSPWPWVRTDIALVAACVFMVFTLIVHLSMEQSHLNRMNHKVAAIEDEINEGSRRRLYALLKVSHNMVQQSEPQGVFECITRSCVEMFECDQSSLMLVDQKTGRLVVRAAHGHLDPSKVLGSEKEIGEGIAGWAAKHKQPLILGNGDAPNECPQLKLLSPTLTAAIVVPIILRDELVGVINISSREKGVAYRDEDLNALSVFAENAGACIRQAERAEWMRKTISSLRAQLAHVGEPVRSEATP
jgi:transcriptional regulator with GAF, ATPase, and Fis domain